MTVYQSKERDVCIGIDFGTAYSTVSVYWDDDIQIISNHSGQTRIPHDDSIQYKIFKARADQAARCANISNKKPCTTTVAVKRMMGWRYSDPRIQKQVGHTSLNIAECDSMPMIRVMHTNDELKLLYPHEIAAIILAHLKSLCEAHINQQIRKCVIAIPATSSHGERRAVCDAAKIAGLDVLRLITTPAAASIAVEDRAQKPSQFQSFEVELERNILFIDLGAGSISVGLLCVEDEVHEVKAVSGDTHFGGNDLDDAIVEYVLEQMEIKGLEFDVVAMNKLRRESERGKCVLSVEKQVDLKVQSLQNNLDFEFTLTRSQFEDLSTPLMNCVVECIEVVLADSKVEKAGIDEVRLLGGSSRIPSIRQRIQNYFKLSKDTPIVGPDLDSSTLIAHGAAIQAAIFSVAHDSNESFKDVLLLEVTPSSLGIETGAGWMKRLIYKQQTVPCKTSETYTTYSDNGGGIMLHVYAGERQKTKDNHLVGRFELSGIPPAPRGVPQIEVRFDLDANGILSVTAFDKKNGCGARGGKIGVLSSYSAVLSKDVLGDIIKNGLYANQESKMNLEKFVLFGFIRNIEKLLEGNKTIPYSIYDLCFVFQYA